MTTSIRCGCGSLVQGSSDDELLAAAERHVEEAHADALSLLAAASLGRLHSELGELDRRLRALEAR